MDYLKMHVTLRLNYWKNKANKSHNAAYKDWRKYAKGSIGYKIKPAGFYSGFNGEGKSRQSVFVAYSSQLPELIATEIIGARHTGYYTDEDCNNMAIGIISKLPHGRYIAGYKLTDNDERAYFPDIYDSKREAAISADNHAEHIAELERENDTKCREALAYAEEYSDKKHRLMECLALRNNKSLGQSARIEARELINTLRIMRDNLAYSYRDYL